MLERLKLVVIGDCNCGKTCFIRMCSEKRFIKTYTPTVGVDYGVIKYYLKGEEKIEVDVFDLSGGPLFHEVRNEFYKECHGVLLFYDVSNKASFVNLDDWLNEMLMTYDDINQFKNLHITIIGNKIDKSRDINFEECLRWAEERGVDLLENSLTDGRKTKELFEKIISSILQYHKLGSKNRHLNFYSKDQMDTINKILLSKSDEEMLLLKANYTFYNPIIKYRKDINRNFRKLSMLIHPDKCSAYKGEEAFKKLVAARNNLSKYLN
ncbi:hypothetical protein HELRODRAFT_165227 [Helobdella robusta]|uniref:J domain-containing protein n=1 Tax=Helobdella robusta TaxID=6412 RepID=T1EWG6_HELRO|nr:hypothetical protein HELRODRAFT_165227 [Helobdella robusta]ESN93068.1 hypothetical protein HELRODRAFT_165227 [Helobdella robusta]